ncbi:MULTISPECIES: hypothetical protein [unclassified Gordonia (in: high G+C Gram-positive bacteria)]|uniref:hypothetical protein n=1 Tax=unclassified Gordonia (in: high G+C Gram-positive bacteria) TaxID=2657482 RepID=UPI0007EA3215|nr:MULTISPECIES: hypothetical protein [unclassified Gordonia (in: high G+C Gram-positive bacteria)]OBC06031.1 hypothetical protein A5785_11775 [Gordonia sp. 852002-50395_SCH5434458]OBC12260.1 hypothetical protein A5788_21815 [Gordonia sp. 852002-50816_SCH5313054-c]OBC20531.1 hypothetical protein A5786_16050 [Gordonia sp. 852002-50816_SCH5313054-a]
MGSELSTLAAGLVPLCRVAVAAAEGVDVEPLVEACRAVAAETGGAAGSAIDFVTFDPNRDLAGAHAAVLVIDPASAVVDDEDLAALRELTSAVEHVALVCCRIESFWDWPRIVRGYRSELDPAGALPVFAVSAAAALAGAVEESGIGDLLDWFATPNAEPTARIPQPKTPQAPTPVDTDDRVDPDALAIRRARLLALRDRGRADRLASLRAGIVRVRAQSSADITARVRALVARAEHRGAATTGSDVEADAAWLDREIDGLVTDLDAITDTRLDAVASSTLVGLDVDDPPAHRDDEPIVARRDLPSGRRTGEDAMLLLIGASTGIGIGRLAVAPLASVHTLQWISMPAALLLGLAVAVWVIRMRRAATVRAQVRTWVNDVLADVRARVERRVAMQLTEAESRIGGQVLRAYDRQGRRIADEVAEIDQRLRELRAAGGAVSGGRQ